MRSILRYGEYIQKIIKYLQLNVKYNYYLNALGIYSGEY